MFLWVDRWVNMVAHQYQWLTDPLFVPIAPTGVFRNMQDDIIHWRSAEVQNKTVPYSRLLTFEGMETEPTEGL